MPAELHKESLRRPAERRRAAAASRRKALPQAVPLGPKSERRTDSVAARAPLEAERPALASWERRHTERQRKDRPLAELLPKPRKDLRPAARHTDSAVTQAPLGAEQSGPQPADERTDR
jgi:hypothetical protein